MNIKPTPCAPTVRHAFIRTFATLFPAVFLIAAGCEDSGPTVAANAGKVVGTYTLTSVDGKAVPCALTHGGHSMTVSSGSFVIDADGTCRSKIEFKLPSGQPASKEVTATYTCNGSKLTMKWQGAGTTTGTVDGDTFTMNNEGMVFAYHR